VNRILLAVALTSFVVAGAGCQSMGGKPAGSPASSAAASGDVPSQLAVLVEQHCDALRRKDTSFGEKYWADNFTFIDPRGRVLTKAQRLENIRTGATNFKSLHCNEVKTQSFGNDWAVTTCRAILEGQYSGQEGTGDYRCTFFWAKPKGTWQAVGLQMTRIER
jgi:hypothetical protein